MDTPANAGMPKDVRATFARMCRLSRDLLMDDKRSSMDDGIGSMDDRTDSMDDKFRVCLSSMSKSLESLHICAIRCIMDDRFLHLPAVHELGMPIQKAAGSHGEVPCSHGCPRGQSTPLSSCSPGKGKYSQLDPVECPEADHNSVLWVASPRRVSSLQRGRR